jgi:asparagine synthase (glutamine-hydrolysing)
MQAQRSDPIKTFSIGLAQDSGDEAQDAKTVAPHLGTDHTELYVTPQQARDVIPRLPQLYDEPFADSSQIPTFLVSQLARQHVTVALSGDGGDELFAGYNRHFRGRTLWQTAGWLPYPLRRAGASALNRLPPERLHKLGNALSARTPDELYERLVSQWQDPAAVVLGARAEQAAVAPDSALGDFTQRMLHRDTVTYLPDDILVKLDRAGMGVSLESRVPLLDPHVFAFAWQVPLGMKLRHGRGKWLLRQVLYQYVPQRLVERPKSGFALPIDRWLRGPLRNWAESLLDERRLRQQGLLDPQPIRQRWAEHLSGQRNWQSSLWVALMFQQWLAQQNADSA